MAHDLYDVVSSENKEIVPKQDIFDTQPLFLARYINNLTQNLSINIFTASLRKQTYTTFEAATEDTM